MFIKPKVFMNSQLWAYSCLIHLSEKEKVCTFISDGLIPIHPRCPSLRDTQSAVSVSISIHLHMPLRDCALKLLRRQGMTSRISSRQPSYHYALKPVNVLLHSYLY